MSTKRATDSESISTVPAPGIRGYQVVLSLAEREATEKITALRMRQIDQVNALLDPETRNARQPTAGSEK